MAVIGGSGWYSQIRYEAMKAKETATEKERHDVEKGEAPLMGEQQPPAK